METMKTALIKLFSGVMLEVVYSNENGQLHWEAGPQGEDPWVIGYKDPNGTDGCHLMECGRVRGVNTTEVDTRASYAMGYIEEGEFRGLLKKSRRPKRALGPF